MNWSEIQEDIDDFARRLRLQEFFDKDGYTTTDASSHPVRCNLKGLGLRLVVEN